MTIEPEIVPGTVGVKLTASMQEAPAASPAELKFLAEWLRGATLGPDPGGGQVELPLRANPEETFGFVPETGTSKVNGVFPLLVIVANNGLSLLVLPIMVVAKESEDACVVSISTTSASS